MKALVKIEHGLNKLEITEMPVPKIDDNEVRILIKTAGICGTDLHILHDKFRTNPPVILGHEFSGEIVEIGDKVTGFTPGDRIVAETAYEICGQCEACKTGNYNICKKRKGIGYDVNGVFAKYFVTKEHLLHKIPENVNYKTAALSEPIATCIHGLLEKVKINPGDKVVITGPGPIGIISALLAKISGGQVYLLGLSSDERRFRIANKIGIENTINIEIDKPVNKVKELMNGEEADIFVECSGAESAVNLAPDILKPMGTYAQIGIFGDKININFNKFIEKEISITTSFSHNWKAWERAVDILSLKQEEFDPIITTMDLDNWETAFRKLENKEAVKVVFNNF